MLKCKNHYCAQTYCTPKFSVDTVTSVNLNELEKIIPWACIYAMFKRKRGLRPLLVQRFIALPANFRQWKCEHTTRNTLRT